MGLKDLAALAVEADEAQEKAAKAENQRNHAKAAELAVQQHLGVTGKCVAAPTWTPDANMAERRASSGGYAIAPVAWGHGTTIIVEDDDIALTIAVSNIGEALRTPHSSFYGNTYGNPAWKFTVTHIDGIDLDDYLSGRAGYKSRPNLVWNDVKFLPKRDWYDRSPALNEVSDLAGIGRLIQAWEAFQAKRDAHDHA